MKNKSDQTVEILSPFLNELINRSTDMIAAIDMHYHYLFLNGSLSETLKKAIGRNVMEGDYVFEGVSEENRDDLKPFFEKGFNGQSNKFEFKYRIDDVQYYTEVSISPLYHNGSNEIYAIGLIARDITDRVKERSEIEKAHRELSLAHEVAKIGSWRFDLQSNALYLSAAKQQLMEMESVSQNDFIISADKFIRDYVMEEDCSLIINSLNELSQQGKEAGSKFTVRYRLKEKNGKRKTLEVTAVKLNANLIYGVTQDITEQRITEKEIIKTKNHLHSIIENTNDSIWLVDKKGNLIVFNEAYRNVFEKLQIKIQNNQTLEKRFEKQSSLGSASKWKERYETVLKGNRLEFEEQIEMDGQIYFYEGTLNPVIEKEKVVGVAGISRDVTERKKATYELNKRKQQLDSIIENTKDSIWLVDHNGVMVLYNTSAKITLKKLFNVTFQENATIEQRLGGKMPLDYISLWQQRYKKALQGNQFTFVEKLDTIEGTLYYEITLNPVIESESLTGVSVYAHDITESKLREELLAKNNLLLNAVIESPTKTIIFSLDRNYRYTSFNKNHQQTMKAIWGCEIELNKIMLDYIKVEKDLQKAKENFDRALNGESFNIVEEYGEEPNRFFYEDAYNPIFDNNGNVTGLTVFLFDITQTKIAEIALRESENRLSYALDATGEGVWDWNIRTRELYCNQAWLNILEYNSDEYKGTIGSFLECLPEDDRSYISREMFRCLRGEIPKFDLEHKLKTKKGNMIWVLNRGKIVEYTDDGKALRMVGSLINITSRKKEEQDKAKLLEELTRRNKDLEQFTYIISHNLRAPVAKILGIVELIRENYESENMKELVLEILSKESEELDTVIKDLNDIISIRNTDKEAFGHLMIKDLFEKTLSTFKTDIKRNNVIVEYDFQKANEVFGIGSYLQSIFYNLISNSIKYRNQQVTPNIKVTSQLTHNFVEITFADNGLGFDSDMNTDKVFGLYKRFHHHIGGKGMGLYITKTQVEIMGGKVKVKSKKGEGTVFNILLPVKPS